MKTSLMLSTGLALTTLVGCASEPTDEDYDDVAAGVGALVAADDGGEVGAMSDSIEGALGTSGLTRVAEGRFEGARAGLAYAYSLTCRDASGDVMSACDRSTDSAEVNASWSGNVDIPRYTASLDRSGTWTLTDVQSEVASFEGHGELHVSSDFMALFRPEMRSFDFDYEASYEDIRIRTANGVITSGTITYDVHAKRMRTTRGRDVDAELDIAAVVTFRGDGTAELTLDGDRTYEVNLASGAVTAP